MNTGPLVENLYAAPPRGPLGGAAEENWAHLLELRTDVGPLYVHPSGWQRIWLLWTFRHFHVLPQQLLSRRAQRLIETLSHSARVTPSLPVSRSTVFGVVENVHLTPEILTGPFEKPTESKAQDRPVDEAPEARFRQWWGVLAMAVAVCLILILAYDVNLLTGTRHIMKSSAVLSPAPQPVVRVSSPAQPAAEPVEQPAARPEPAFVARKAASLARPVIEPEPEAAPAEWIAPAGDAKRTFIAELPQGHLVQPVLADRNLTGELELRALIGADGSVKDVTVVSGNLKLATAAISAVRRWHYAQNQATGLQGDAETLIRMNFYGRDAVSITSVAR